ncbi:glycosyl transferase [Alishewanella jeotgali KCTC 22429]|uniref:Glycosyl transferase n=2 Tax=Alishewanella jeotgali TaxID=545533 RepID=H3ZB99_9ALTE|nr:glycosyl transferase [Alishewanella jeotgali KCTC 22429]
MQKDLAIPNSALRNGFIELSCGRCFLLTHIFLDSTSAVIALPPFAEEINKTRHLVGNTMRQLSAAGLSCFMLDNYGTGDSEGDLDTASTAIWREDIVQLLRQLQQQGFTEVSFVAIRFGALQLFDLLNSSPMPLTVKQIVLWQPFFEVAKFWQQFARIRVAEAMARGEKLSQKELEQQLNNGNTIEIAGYPISPAFYQSLLKMQTQLPTALNSLAVSWFETSQLDSIALPVQKMRDTLQHVCELQFYQLKADPYWQTNELASADELIRLTIHQLTTMPA